MARSIRAAGGRPGDMRARRLRLRPVHRRPRRALRRRAARLHGRPGLRRDDRAAGAADRGLPSRAIIMVTPSYFLAILDEMERPGHRPARAPSLEIGIFGAEPWTDQMRAEIEQRSGMHAVDIYGLSRGDGARASPRRRRDQGRPAHLGGPLLPGGRSTRSPTSVLPDGEEGELVFTVADQAGDAGDPLPHPRPDPAAARHRAPVLPPDGRRSPAAPTT